MDYECIVAKLRALYDSGVEITREAIGALLNSAPSPALCPVPADDQDRTDDIAAWLATLPAGSHATFGASEGRVYRLDKSLHVTADGLTFTDAAFQVHTPAVPDGRGLSMRRHLWFRSCTDLTLDGVSVTGQNTTADDGTPIDQDGQATYDPKREFEHALAVEDCERVTVTNFTADAIFGDGTYWRRVTDGRLDGFTISRNGRQGVALISTDGLILLNGTIRHSRRSGIDLEPNFPDEVIANVEIGHMKIRSRLIPLTAGGPGTVRDVWVHDIEATSASVPTLSLVPNRGGRRDNWTVERWTTTNQVGSPNPVVRGLDVAGLILRDFTALCNQRREMTAVGIRNAGPVTLERCDFTGAGRLADFPEPAEGHTFTAVDCTP